MLAVVKKEVECFVYFPGFSMQGCDFLNQQMIAPAGANQKCPMLTSQSAGETPEVAG
jgi:hypothetical protein